MFHSIKIEGNGDSIDLSSSKIYLKQDGYQFGSVSGENQPVTDVLTLYVVGDYYKTLQALERILSGSKRWFNYGDNSPVFIKVQMESGGDEYISPIIDYSLDDRTGAFGSLLPSGVDGGVFPVTLTIVRDGNWYSSIGYGVEDTNLVSNGDFSGGSINWSWSASFTSATGDGTLYKSFNNSLKVEATVGTPFVYLEQSSITISPSTAYTLAADLRTNDTTQSITFQVEWYNGGSFISSSGINVFPPEDRWERYSVTATSPATADNCKVMITTTANAYVGYVFWVDDVELYPSAAGTIAGAGNPQLYNIATPGDGVESVIRADFSSGTIPLNYNNGKMILSLSDVGQNGETGLQLVEAEDFINSYTATTSTPADATASGGNYLSIHPSSGVTATVQYDISDTLKSGVWYGWATVDNQSGYDVVPRMVGYVSDASGAFPNNGVAYYGSYGDAIASPSGKDLLYLGAVEVDRDSIYRWGVEFTFSGAASAGLRVDAILLIHESSPTIRMLNAIENGGYSVTVNNDRTEVRSPLATVTTGKFASYVGSPAWKMGGRHGKVAVFGCAPSSTWTIVSPSTLFNLSVKFRKVARFPQ